MNINVPAIRTVFPHAAPGWLEAVASEVPQITEINTTNELCSFLANVGVESEELTRFEENLYYSTAQRLVDVWPHRFGLPVNGHVPSGLIDPTPFVRNPQALANYVYADANRTQKIGNTQPNDGWMYRGRGPIQITGGYNYQNCGVWMGVDLLNHPELLTTPVPGIRSACWFWVTNGLDRFDDDLDIRAERKIVNGGEVGLAQAQAYFKQLLEVLS